MISGRLAFTGAILLCCAASLGAQTRMPDWSGQWEIVGAAPSVSGGFQDSLDQVLKETQWSPPNKPEVQARVNVINAEERKRIEAIQRGEDVAVTGPTCTFGFPMIMIDSPLMFEIVPTPKETALIFSGREVRHVYTDGRAHTPKDELWPTPWGDSIGHWEGETLVTDTIAVKSPFPDTGPDFLPVLAAGGEAGQAQLVSYLSSQAHFVERIRMVDKDHLEEQMTIIDPVNLTAPWHLTRTYRRAANLHRMVYESCEGDGEDRNPIVNGHYTIRPPRSRATFPTPVPADEPAGQAAAPK
jgi:hypothetical protein